MIKTARKQLTPKRKMKASNETINTIPTQKVSGLISQLHSYFQIYTKMNDSIRTIVKNLNSLHYELDSLGQFTITRASQTILIDIHKRWENTKKQIINAIQKIESSDGQKIINKQIQKLQTSIDRVSQSPPSTPKAQAESNELYLSLQEQINKIIQDIATNDSNSKEDILVLRNDLSHKYEFFFKSSQISKTWKRTVIDDCKLCLDKIICYLDFPSGVKINLPVDLSVITNGFHELLALDFPTGQPKKFRSTSVSNNTNNQHNSIKNAKGNSQTPKVPRSKSAQSDVSKSLSKPISLMKGGLLMKNVENNNILENMNKNILENSQLLPRDNKNNSRIKNVSKSISPPKESISTPQRVKKSRLPKRAFPETPSPLNKQFQNTLSPQISLNTKKQINIQNQEKISSPIGDLLNSPQIEMDENLSSKESEFDKIKLKSLDPFNEDDLLSINNDVLGLRMSPKIEEMTKEEKSLSPTDIAKNLDEIMDPSLEILNKLGIDELINDSDSEELEEVIKIEKGISPSLEKFRNDLVSITNSYNNAPTRENLSNESFEQTLNSFLSKFEDHLPLIQANCLLNALYELVKKAIKSIKNGQQQQIIYALSKIQELISSIEEELIDNLTLDNIDLSILEVGKMIKILSNHLFKEDPTQPILEQFECIQKRLENIRDGNPIHFLNSEIDKLYNMKSLIKEYSEIQKQQIKTDSNEKKKIINEMKVVQQRIVFLKNKNIEPTDNLNNDVELEINDLLNQQSMLIERLSNLEK